MLTVAMTSNDVVIRNTANEGFELVDAQTHKHLAGRYDSFAVAIAVARSYTTGAVFHQVLDNRGRVMGEPMPVPSSLHGAPQAAEISSL